jgi:hypothetical protein
MSWPNQLKESAGIFTVDPAKEKPPACSAAVCLSGARARTRTAMLLGTGF